MVSQRLTTGLINNEHQKKLLSEAADLDTLDKKIQRIVSLESTEDAQDQMRQASKSYAVRSQYKKQQSFRPAGKDPTKQRENVIIKRRKPTQQRRRCRGCGKTSHGEDKMMMRKIVQRLERNVTIVAYIIIMLRFVSRERQK